MYMTGWAIQRRKTDAFKLVSRYLTTGTHANPKTEQTLEWVRHNTSLDCTAAADWPTPRGILNLICGQILNVHFVQIGLEHESGSAIPPGIAAKLGLIVPRSPCRFCQRKLTIFKGLIFLHHRFCLKSIQMARGFITECRRKIPLVTLQSSQRQDSPIAESFYILIKMFIRVDIK